MSKWNGTKEDYTALFWDKFSPVIMYLVLTAQPIVEFITINYYSLTYRILP